MGKPNFSEDFKRDAVHQVTVRGYAVREVSERLGVSTYSLYKWMKLYAKAASQASSVVNGGVKFGHCGGAKVGQFGASALERAALI